MNKVFNKYKYLFKEYKKIFTICVVLIILQTIIGIASTIFSAFYGINVAFVSGDFNKIIIYAILFLMSVFTVAHIIPYGYALIVVALTIAILDRKVLFKVDYNLLLTFIAFFIFIGNMGRVPAFYELLQKWMTGNEVPIGIVASQVMSNVPAALLLSGFTDNVKALIVATNLGGLGTLIASMASLISFKFIARDYGHLKGKYLICFTVANILFLAVLFILFLLL